MPLGVVVRVPLLLGVNVPETVRLGVRVEEEDLEPDRERVSELVSVGETEGVAVKVEEVV